MATLGLVFILIAVLASQTPDAFGATQQQELTAVTSTRIDTGSTTSHIDKAGRSPERHQRNPRYELSRGDSFDLILPLTPDFNQSLTVQPDGYVTLAGMGDLYLAGKTIPELRELLQARYSTILHDPVINIVVKDFEKSYFIAGGEVARPGKYDLRDDTTVTEAIAIAGGFTPNSKHSQVLLFRRVSSDWVEVKKLDVKRMFQAANLAEDLHLEPGDMFFVPQNRISKIGKYIPNPGIGMQVTHY
jgi:polysaccharide export outer membrane protein